MKVLRLFLIGLFILLGGIPLWLGYDYYRFLHLPADSKDLPLTFEISTKVSFNTVAQRLLDAGIISNFLKFKILARYRGEDKRLKAGEYRLSPVMTPVQVLETLVNGKVLLHRLTVPEGYTIREIAAEMKRTGLWDSDAFLELSHDAQLAAEFQIPAETLEGYLFPDTYFFARDAPARTIITRMVRRFNEQFSQQLHQRAQELSLSVHQVVTLASIIEKETGDGSERPIIASVFHNRMRRKMRLESDPTVIYGIENFDGNITRVHLTTPTPYNTYVIPGLPPGPIANPGRLAIEATLFPAETDFIFFVSKKDGTHVFSSTYAEHNEAVRQYQLRRRKQ